MDYIGDGLKEAIRLLLAFDREIYAIILLSLGISMASTVVSTLIGVPIGLVLALRQFPMKKLFARILYTCMSLPPVVVGLIVAIFLSRRGPMGNWQLLFTPAAMVNAQVLLITPIIMGIIFNNTKQHGPQILQVGKTLGGNRLDILVLLIREMRINMLIAIVTGFGRAISEVGAVMLVGGNIKGHTRVMTTFIAMNNSMGNYATSIAMGIVLLLISFVVNSFLYKYVAGE